ncbi:MAG TPA: hypothetical protein VIB38_13460 [Aestuariivirgaceae bacterium]|jgi:hypothetical protein
MRPATALAAAVLATWLAAIEARSETYPIIAYGARTFVAEATESRGTILIRVYRRTGRTTWHRYGGFTLPAGQLQARRAAVRRNPEAASAAERVYFAGQVIGSTSFQPSHQLYRHTPFRFRKRRN